MIETEQSTVVAAPIHAVWDYVKDIARWAEIMPGYRECDLIDENASLWTLKVGVGGLVRTVKVDVHVDAWNGPGEVLFTYRLKGDPVEGGGAYTARATDDGNTEIALRVSVIGSGPMAPMWEAMGKPLLPQFAKSFAEELRGRIEAHLGTSAAPAGAQYPDKKPVLARLIIWLKSIFGGGRTIEEEQG